MTNMNDFITRPSVAGEYILTENDRKLLKSKAVNGVIPFSDYHKTLAFILNRQKEKKL